MQGFVGNQTFRIHATSGATAYLKTGTAIAAEAHAIQQAEAVGIPVPEILATSLGQPQYLILAEVSGEPSDDPKVLIQAVHALRTLHEIHYPEADAGGDAGADWAGRLSLLIDDLDKLKGVVPDELAGRLRATMPQFIAEVAAVPASLLHGDLHARHLYAVDGKLTAILDWGDACYGDPLYDLARLTMTANPATVVATYGGMQNENLQRTLSCYRVLWSLAALHAEHAAGGDWFEPHVRRIAAELS
ncbi:phosphotransferase family protein [Kribbella sp. NPDC056951]|uniref:phosphotransferase family protein n=1 Tax=Kribbella sp. NPDC056951 TaxID=3345978 RepID=UPI00363AECFE